MTAPTVVTNAGPLMVLSKLNLLYILKHLFYTNVHIPRSVYEETVVKGVQHGYEDAKTLQTFLSQQQLYFSQIEQRTDIWISPTLCRQVLAQIMKHK